MCSTSPSAEAPDFVENLRRYVHARHMYKQAHINRVCQGGREGKKEDDVSTE